MKAISVNRQRHNSSIFTLQVVKIKLQIAQIFYIIIMLPAVLQLISAGPSLALLTPYVSKICCHYFQHVFETDRRPFNVLSQFYGSVVRLYAQARQPRVTVLMLERVVANAAASQAPSRPDSYTKQLTDNNWTNLYDPQTNTERFTFVHALLHHLTPGINQLPQPTMTSQTCVI